METVPLTRLITKKQFAFLMNMLRTPNFHFWIARHKKKKIKQHRSSLRWWKQNKSEVQGVCGKAVWECEKGYRLKQYWWGSMLWCHRDYFNRTHPPGPWRLMVSVARPASQSRALCSQLIKYSRTPESPQCFCSWPCLSDGVVRWVRSSL